MVKIILYFLLFLILAIISSFNLKRMCGIYGTFIAILNFIYIMIIAFIISLFEYLKILRHYLIIYVDDY